MTVLEGRVEIKMDGRSIILSAGDPTVFIPPRVVHSMKGFKGERMILREQADPPGLYKAL